MENNLAKTYDHNNIETKIYEWWEKNDYFRPEKQRELGLVNDASERYCITLPLPNVTGILHLGHAITIATEDLMARFERMKQKETVYIPGTDHAGIATQAVVERELLKEGIRRQDLGREKFVQKVWEWKEIYHSRITEQAKRLGISCDWQREFFTLDPQLTRAVREAFYRLYQKELIYRGEYMVNWCPRCESAISDLEAEPKDLEGQFWYIKYPVLTDQWTGPQGEWGSGNWAKGADRFIIVATTRPETLLGDSAIATHNAHPEYGDLVGQKTILPAVGRELTIIADQHVDPEFGTGAVKITPAHDPDDFEVGHRHHLEFINIFDETAHVLSGFNDKYTGMDRFECRDAIVADLEKEGLLLKTEPITHAVGHCQRCHTIIEPRISLQWFVKTKTLADAALAKVKQGETTILPEREENRFYHWMTNIRDWCISRQLWWGHQIPIWYCRACEKQICPKPDVNSVETCPHCGSSDVYQDPDVLDTWFSSALWTFATLGWPDTKHSDFQRFFRTDMRETGYDILFFWVAREMMMGVELTGEAPYKHVYLHGIIRDEHGQKVSKSMENIADYDPLNMIRDYGADSLRYVLLANSVAGMDMNLNPHALDPAHRFCNKIWQASRYVLLNIAGGEPIPAFKDLSKSDLKFPDKWILSRLNRTVQNVTNWLNTFDYLQAAREVKNFFWNDFCDWYIEISKIRIYSEENRDLVPKTILLHVLQTCYRLIHPFMPFISEELWQALPSNFKPTDAIIIAPWPQVDESYLDMKIEENYRVIFDVIREVRRIKHDFSIPLSNAVQLMVDLNESPDYFKNTKATLLALGGVDGTQLLIGHDIEPPAQAARFVIHGITGYIPLQGVIDLAQEILKLQKELEKITKEIQKREKKLNSPFAARAPPELVNEEKEKLKKAEHKKTELEEQIRLLS